MSILERPSDKGEELSVGKQDIDPAIPDSSLVTGPSELGAAPSEVVFGRDNKFGGLPGGCGGRASSILFALLPDEEEHEIWGELGVEARVLDLFESLDGEVRWRRMVFVLRGERGVWYCGGSWGAGGSS